MKSCSSQPPRVAYFPSLPHAAHSVEARFLLNACSSGGLGALSTHHDGLRPENRLVPFILSPRCSWPIYRRIHNLTRCSFIRRQPENYSDAVTNSTYSRASQTAKLENRSSNATCLTVRINDNKEEALERLASPQPTEPSRHPYHLQVSSTSGSTSGRQPPPKLELQEISSQPSPEYKVRITHDTTTGDHIFGKTPRHQEGKYQKITSPNSCSSPLETSIEGGTSKGG